MAALTHFVYNLASEPMAVTRLKREPDAFMASFGLSAKQAKIVKSNDFHLLGKAICKELDDAEGNSSYFFQARYDR